MDSKVYDLNAIADLTYEKQSIVRQLSEMFYGFSLIYIRGICEACLWNVDLCIDKLIGGNDRTNKKHNQPQQQQQLKKPLSYAQISNENTCGAVPKSSSAATTIITSKPSPRVKKPFSEDLPESYSHVYHNILKGYKVLVLMRGVPGTGKSYLAKWIVSKLLPGSDWKDFVFGADDYFFDDCGKYRYNADRLENAHEYCKTRAREKMLLGYSPVIIDNTNIQIWEMMCYAKIGVENGYLIEIVEPVTPWRNSAGKLAAKNVHNVPKLKIQRMMDKYQIATGNDLLGLLRDTKYTVSLPQLRTYPSPPKQEPEPEEEPSYTPEPPVQLATPSPSPPPPPPSSSPSPPLSPLPLKEQRTPKKTIMTATPTLNLEAVEFVPRATPPAFADPQNMWPNFEQPTTQNQMVKEDDKEENVTTDSKALNPKAANFWGPFASLDTNNDYNHAMGDDMMQSELFPAVPTAWQAYEQEATNFWGVPVSVQSSDSVPEPMAMDESNSSTCGLLQLLKEGVKSINVSKRDQQPNDDEETFKLVRHRVGCSRENEAFISFRQIYPNKPNAELWDLFTKCNGSIDWAVDILLKDEDSIATNHNAFEESLTNLDNFDCYCDNPEASAAAATSSDPLPPANVKEQRPNRFRNRAALSPAHILEVKDAVEKSFVIGDEHYSSHIKKIRNKRNATEDISIKKTLIDVNVQTEDVDDNNSDEGCEESEVIEINLGENLIAQLSEIFVSETSNLEAPEKYKTNVFMPKSLARELYVLWMESVYNQQEEQRQTLLKEDEEFALLLKNPKYENFKQPPENIKELLDMEYAWMVYKKEQEELNGVTSKHPNDLASHLTRMKLCEIFPNIPRETLIDILEANDNKFSDTVEVLKNAIQLETVDNKVSAELLIEKARTESEMLKEEENNQEQKLLTNNNSNSFQKTHSKQLEPSNRQRSLSPEEAKRLALSEFEETRNYAAHHCQLRAECYQKAKESIQRGNSGVAVYYSQIANLHKRKIDIYNHRAANCIMEVHDLTQNNPDFIDLHYLHVIEAVSCLDIFVDRHIAKLRSIFRSYKYVFIITGRGLHSAGGVSMIKTRVKSRLKERNLKWSEVNPGLLKVKIFSASKYSKNL